MHTEDHLQSSARMLPPGRERFGFSQTRKPARKPCGRQAAGKGKGHEPALTIPHDAAGIQASGPVKNNGLGHRGRELTAALGLTLLVNLTAA
jgi:hypothetical protein